MKTLQRRVEELERTVAVGGNGKAPCSCLTWVVREDGSRDLGGCNHPNQMGSEGCVAMQTERVRALMAWGDDLMTSEAW